MNDNVALNSWLFIGAAVGRHVYLKAGNMSYDTAIAGLKLLRNS